MDRRSFLTTGATVALLPLTEAPAFAQARRQRRCHAQRPVRGDLPGRGPNLADARDLARPRQGPECRAQVETANRPGSPVSAARTWRATAARSRSCRRSAAASLSDAAKLNREVVLYQLETATAAPSRWNINSAQRPYPIFQQGGAYFSIPDFLNSAHTIDNAADAEAYLSRLEPVRDGARQRHRRAARAGRARLPRAGLVDRPDARPDAQAARHRARAEHDGRVDRQAHARQAHRRRLGRARGEDRRRLRSIPRSTGRSR